MKKTGLSILLALVASSSYAQSNWSYLESKNLNAGIGITSTDGMVSINYLKNESRSQLLLIAKKDMNCLVCNMQFNFNNRPNVAEVEYLYKNKNNEYVYAVLNKSLILRGFSYSSGFNLINQKTNSVHNFTGSVPVKFFNNSDFVEWKKRNYAYETDSLNYYSGKNNDIIYATVGVNANITSLKALTLHNVSLNCNNTCEAITYFAGGKAVYKLIKEDNVGRITYRLPESFITDMQTYNKNKDYFSMQVKTVERGDMVFKFDSATYSDKTY